MTDITVFGEDYAHEVIVRTLLQRVAVDHELPVRIQVRSAAGGHARMIRELKQYIDELKRGQACLPDVFVVARDANCDGYAKRVREIQAAMAEYDRLAVHAVPDPHIERWLLVDSKAFKAVLGRGCQAPNQKCDRDRYKTLLNAAVRDAGIEAPLGGLEFAEDIIRAMNLGHAGRSDTSLAHLIRDLGAAFEQCKQK